MSDIIIPLEFGPVGVRYFQAMEHARGHGLILSYRRKGGQRFLSSPS